MHTIYLKLLSQFQAGRDISFAGTANEAKLHSFLEVHNLMTGMQDQATVDAGMEFGCSIPAIAHGFMGQAAAASPNLRVTMETLARFIAIRSNFYTVEFSTDKSGGTLSIQPRFELGEHSPFIQTTTLFSFVQLFSYIVRPIDLKKLHYGLPWKARPRPGLFAELGLTPPEYTPGAAPTLTLPYELLEQENITADHRQFTIGIRACEEELAGLNGAISAKVKYLLEEYSEPGWPQLSYIADRIGISSRTLTRKLAAQGTSYSELSDLLRCNLACWYLHNSELPIAHISDELGYSDSSNFSRTFRKWMGVTPQSYRAKKAVGDNTNQRLRE